MAMEIAAAVEDWNIQVETGNSIVVMKGVIVKGQLSGGGQEVECRVAQSPFSKSKLGGCFLLLLESSDVRALCRSRLEIACRIGR